MKKVVAKFGGSSVRDANALRDCVRVVKDTADLGVVVISATYNTTNELEELFSLLKKGEDESALWEALKERHRIMARDLGCEEAFEDLITALEAELIQIRENAELSYEHRDHLLSFGERISSQLFAWVLREEQNLPYQVELLDATIVIKTDSTYGMAFPQEELILERVQLLKSRALDNTLFVTQGFLGSDSLGKRTTLGREGSDYTATLLAGAFDAKEVHIWTDVDGVYTADPHIIERARRLDTLSYREATLLAKAGAKVLFPKTLAPLKEKKIPLRVGKTKAPQEGGTWVGGDHACSKDLIGLTLKERSDGLIITLIGHGVESLDIEQSEIDRGECYRSFYHPAKDIQDVLNLWYERYFS